MTPDQQQTALINNLPDDILYIICQISGESDRDYPVNWDGFTRLICISTAMRISHVCSRWRALALSRPTLWARTTIQLPIYTPSQWENVNTILDRAKTCLLDLQLLLLLHLDDETEELVPEQSELLRMLIARSSELEMEVELYQPPTELWEGSDVEHTGLPLRYMSWSSDSRNPEHVTFLTTILKYSTNLEELVLREPHYHQRWKAVPSLNLPSLTHLTITGSGGLAFLGISRFEALKSLTMIACIDQALLPSQPDRPPFLPRLVDMFPLLETLCLMHSLHPMDSEEVLCFLDGLPPLRKLSLLYLDFRMSSPKDQSGRGPSQALHTSPRCLDVRTSIELEGCANTSEFLHGLLSKPTASGGSCGVASMSINSWRNLPEEMKRLLEDHAESVEMIHH